MTQPFHSIVSYEEDNWEQFLERILLIDIFMPVIKHYTEPGVLKSVIQYIVYAYSKDSDKVILDMEWQKNKQQIFEFVLAKPMKGVYEDLVLLKNDKVIESIHKWLEYQDSFSWKQLCVLKDLLVEMQLSAVSKILKSSGEVDYSQKFLNAEYATKLKQMIRDLENELIQNDVKLKEGVKEVKRAKTNGHTVGVEHFAK